MTAEATARQRLTRAALAAGGTLLAAIAAVGFAHTPYGRPLLALLDGAPGCPVSLAALDIADPQKTEAFRAAQVKARAGTEPARSRPAFVFQLGDRRETVVRWLQARGVACEARRRDSVLFCERVETPDLDVEDLHLQFDGNARLVAVDLFRTPCGAEAALELLSRRARNLDAEVGPATGAVGEHDPSYLSSRSYHRVATQYRYRDYVAEISVMSYGSRGLRLRESYQRVG